MRRIFRETRTLVRENLLAGFDRSWERRLFALTFGLVALLYPFGLVFIVGGVLPEEYSWTASVVIFFNAIATVLSETRSSPLFRVLGAFTIVTALLSGVELIGVWTGFPFGTYSYTTVLGFSSLGIPLSIPLAWYTTIFLSWRIAGRLAGNARRFRRVAVALVAGLFTVALDLVLEPMASEIRMYWIWEGGRAALQNYVAWFLFTFLGVYLLENRSPSADTAGPHVSHFAVILYAMQFFLFAATAVVHGKILPVVEAAVVILLVLCVHVATRKLESRQAVGEQ